MARVPGLTLVRGFRIKLPGFQFRGFLVQGVVLHEVRLQLQLHRGIRLRIKIRPGLQPQHKTSSTQNTLNSADDGE